MSVSLKQILDLVGRLNDAPGTENSRERFRRYLRENVTEVGQVRDYIEECLRNKGDQYSRALQDLVNHLGMFLGFEVEFGRYQGVPGQIGHDGHWMSPTNYHVVVEVKTTEVYAVKTSTLANYVNDLISERKIPNGESALGLYVVGRPDAELRQIENAIVAEGRTHQLRMISVESLVSLAELMNDYDVSHEDVLAVIRPSGPTIDPIVDLMARLVAEPKDVNVMVEPVVEPEVAPPVIEAEEEVAYWLTPVKSDEEQTAEEVIQVLVGEKSFYAFGDRTPGRKHLKPGDWICFYATGNGVVAHARVVTAPRKEVRHSERYPWVFELDSTQLYLDNPVVIDAGLRRQLDTFEGRDPNKAWAWFVQATRRITKHDFDILTRQ